MLGRKRSSQRRRRRSPSWWAWILILAPIAVIVWLRSGDRTGDQGMTNVFSGMLTFLAALFSLLWFTFARGYPLRLRLAVLAGVIVLGVGFRYAVAVESWSGSMVPSLSFRWSERAEPPATGTVRPSTAVDLASASVDDYPGFLGPGRDLKVAHVRLARDWDAAPPQELWRQPIGAGWSAFSIVNGVAVTMEQLAGEQAVSVYDAASGELLWRHAWTGPFDHPMGGAGPRSTPTIDAGRVYALGPHGKLLALEGATGAVVWERDLLADYGISRGEEAATVGYGRSGSPLIHGELLIVPVGGVADGRRANLVAYDKTSGEPVWEGSPRQISYASPAAATLAGVEQVLTVNEDTVSGHRIADGRELWSHPWPGRSAADSSNSQAVPVPPDRVFVSKGYGVGAALLRLVPQGEEIAVEELWHESRSLRTKHTNVVIDGEHVYGLSDGILECVELETGQRVWKRGRYGHGQILQVGDLLLLLSEDGEVFLIELTPDEPDKVLGSFQGIEGLTWNNLALSGDLLLIRNGREAAAYRLPLAEPLPSAG